MGRGMLEKPVTAGNERRKQPTRGVVRAGGTIDESPVVVAQGKRLQWLFGDRIRPRVQSSGTPVAQLITLDGGLLDQTVPYPNGQQAEVLTHMAGEWDQKNGTAPTGGHLLDAMVDTWGAAVANSIPDKNSVLGVHFEGAVPNSKVITNHRHNFRLVGKHQGKVTVSAVKESTFWPVDWESASLVKTFLDSHKFGSEWASKANTTYYYHWERMGKTAYPTGRVAKVEGTQRIKRKAGRKRQ